MSALFMWVRALLSDPAFFAWVGLGLLVAGMLTGFFASREQSNHELLGSIAFAQIAIYLRVSERGR